MDFLEEAERGAHSESAICPEGCGGFSTTVIMRNVKLDVFKALCIIGVLLHHVSNKRIDEGVRDYVSVIVGCLTWAIFGFVVCSAYIYAEARSNLGFLAEARSRFSRLMIPYYLIGSVYAVIYCVISGSNAHGFLDSFRRLLFFDEPVGEQLYFLPLLFIAFLAWSLLVKLQLSGSIRFYSALFISVVPYMLYESAGYRVWGRGVTVGTLLVAFSAFGLGWIYSKIQLGRRGCFVLLSLVISALFEFLGVFHGLSVIALALAIMHVCLAIPDRFSSILPMRALSWFGVRSSWVFVFHSPFFIYVPMVIFLKLGISHVLTIILSVVCAVVLSILTGFCISLFKFRKYLLV